MGTATTGTTTTAAQWLARCVTALRYEDLIPEAQWRIGAALATPEFSRHFDAWQRVDAVMQAVNGLESLSSMAELAPLLQKE
jgi:hypothetical protein